MIKTVKNLAILTAGLIILLSNYTEKPKICVIKGKLAGVDSKSILLSKASGDFRFESIEIPVQDSVFEHKIELDNPQLYNLFLGESLHRAGGSFISFILEPGVIEITLFPENEFDKNIVKGGLLNKEYEKYKTELSDKFSSRRKVISDSMKILREKGNYYSDTANTLNLKLRQLKSQDEKIKIYRTISDLEKEGKYLSEPCMILQKKSDGIMTEMLDWQQNYISKNKSILSYLILFESVIHFRDKIDIEKAKKNYKTLARMFPHHPYTISIDNILSSIENIKVGGRYIDFTAPDPEGNKITLSDQIAGKIALIDLWASWCGPCIATSRSMIPVYEEFKDSGFIIVGIAGEFKNLDKLEKTLEREKFPWINLVELDRQNNIWEKYGCPFSGGGTFLVDRNGSILAINASADQIREILKAKF